MQRYSHYKVRHVKETTGGNVSDFEEGDPKRPDFASDFWSLYGFSEETRDEAIGDFISEDAALAVLFRIAGIQGKTGVVEYPVEDAIGNALLALAMTTQTVFWNACRALELYLGFEIDSSQDLQCVPLSQLQESGGAPV